MSVCVKKWRWVYEIDEDRMRVTVLCCEAPLRCRYKSENEGKRKNKLIIIGYAVHYMDNVN